MKGLLLNKKIFIQNPSLNISTAMKTIKHVIFSAIVIILTCNGAFAQNYKTQFAKLDSTGTIKDSIGTTFATISKDSIIKNHKGEKIAFIDRNGNLVDNNGKVLGKAAKNGDFHNVNGQVEYTVKQSANRAHYEVFDKTGKVVLVVPANYKAQAGTMAYVYMSYK